ncbi:MAG TPA: hypothetical protein VF808_00260 [Ktedonobacterales bacterium]
MASIVPRMAARLRSTGAGWALIGAMLLALAAVAPWLRVPLVRAYYAGDFHIQLGWGPRGVLPTYATVCLALAGVFALRAITAWLSHGEWASSIPWRRSLTARTCIAMALISLSVSLLFVYQFTLVDFVSVTRMIGQYDQSSLIRPMFGYTLPQTIQPLAPFQMSGETPADRLGALIEFVLSSTPNIGLFLPVLGSLVLLVGAYRRRQAALANIADPEHSLPRRYVALLVVSLFAVMLLLRAPAGLVCQWFGVQSVNSGSPQAALNWFQRATTLTPTLQDLPTFHQEYGEAQYLAGAQNTLDAGLYLAQQYRDMVAVDQAVTEDMLLAQRYPGNPQVTLDTTLSLEQSIVNQTNQALLPADNEQRTRYSQIAGMVYLNQSAMPSIDELLQVSPNNLYGHYLRGRILYAQGAFEPAAVEFDTVLTLTSDDSTKSSAYTFLAFCADGLGDYTSGRAYLAKAENLDSGYYNTTARQAASGLH